jgi:thiol-disulfide isomerase/thioredoxin
MTVKSIENYDEFKEVISSETLVIIYFGAARCRHCTVASPVFEELSKKPEYDGKHKFYEINTDLVESKKATNNAEIQKVRGRQLPYSWSDVRQIPSFLLFRSGERVTSTNKAGELDVCSAF